MSQQTLPLGPAEARVIGTCSLPNNEAESVHHVIQQAFHVNLDKTQHHMTHDKTSGQHHMTHDKTQHHMTHDKTQHHMTHDKTSGQHHMTHDKTSGQHHMTQENISGQHHMTHDKTSGQHHMTHDKTSGQHHMAQDKTGGQHHMTQDKSLALNMVNIQRLSVLENWRYQYIEQHGGPCMMKLEQSQTDNEYGNVDDCDIVHHNRITGSCSTHGPFTELDPRFGFDSGSLEYTPLPIPAQLTLLPSGIPGDPLGVFATVFINKGVRIGPYEGHRIPVEELGATSNLAYAWELQLQGKRKYLVDGENPTHSNWMRYIKCARNVDEQNVAAYQCHGNIYFQTLRNISPKSEMLVWYKDDYARRHDVALLDESVAKFYCPGCGESFKAKKAYHIHLKHSNCSLSSKSSSSCNTQVVSIQDQIKDLESVVRHHSAAPDHDTSIKNHSQQTCKQEKTDPVTLVCPYCAEHVDHYCCHKTGFDLHEEELTCKNCGNSFSQSDTWRRAEQVYSCEHCDKQFDQKKAFNLHLKSHSNGQNQCTICGKMFTRASNLLRHRRIHSGDRPYSCEHCGKAFRSRSNLQQHLVTHSNIKPHKCEYCGKSFGRVNNLQRHLRIHTGDRPYKCAHCDKSFIQSSHLRKHSRTHTTEKS